jgi:tetratricopeptide (TPR) repeat protein
MRSNLLVAMVCGCGGSAKPAPVPKSRAKAIARVAKPALPAATYALRHTRPPLAVPADAPAVRPPPPPARPVAVPGPPIANKPPTDQELQALGKLVDASGANDPQKPELIFRLARAQQARGRMDDARKAYQRLVKEYPGSKLVAEAYVVLGDHAFEQGKMADAAAFYDRTLEFPKHPLLGYAGYKRAWVHLNTGDHEAALQGFLRAHLGADPALAAACRDGLVRAYVHIGRLDVARVFFARVSKPDADAMFAELVEHYEQAGMAPKAIAGYRELMRGRPRDPRACDWQLGILRGTLMAGKADDQLRQAQALVKLAAQVKTAACDSAAAGQAIALAHAWHGEAQETLRPDTFDRADKLYAAYLAAFPTSPVAAAVRHHRAELLWQRAELDKNPRTGRARWQAVVAAFDALAADATAPAAQRAAATEAARLARENLAAIP